MAKQLRHDGFTLIEMLLVLAIISVFISITMAHPQFNLFHNTTEYEIKKLTSEIDYYQAYAIKSHAPVMLLFRPNRNDIKIETIHPHRVTTIPLAPLQLKMTSNIHALIFDKDGKANQFGTLRFEHQQRAFLLFSILNKGGTVYLINSKQVQNNIRLCFYRKSFCDVSPQYHDFTASSYDAPNGQNIS